MMKATFVVLFCLMAIASSAPAWRTRAARRQKLARRWLTAEAEQIRKVWFLGGFRLHQSADDVPDVSEVEVDEDDATLDACVDDPCGEHGICVNVDADDVDTDDTDDADADAAANDVAGDVDVDGVDDNVDVDDVDDDDVLYFRCICYNGYTGDTCDEFDASSVCADNPCKNDGLCVDVKGAEVDDSDVADVDADVDADADVNVDANDAAVDVGADVDVNEDDVDVDDDSDDDDDADHVCLCPVGFTGRNCEEEIDEEAVAAEVGGDS